MRQILKTVYKYEELSQGAQEKARYDFAADGDYSWSGENEDTLKAFVNLFPVKVTDWSYDSWNGYVSFHFTGDDEVEQLSGIRLMTYIYNNYSSRLFKGKYYSTYGKRNQDGTYRTKGKTRYSKITLTNDCVLTGYCMDHDILQPIYSFLKNPRKNVTFYSLLDDCFHSWIKGCCNDMEYQYSEENFKEMCESNDWEFDENGAMV